MNIFLKSLQSTIFKVLIQLDYFYIKQNVVIVNIMIIINALLADTVHGQQQVQALQHPWAVVISFVEED